MNRPLKSRKCGGDRVPTKTLRRAPQLMEVLSRLVDQRVTRRADCLLSRRCAPSLPRRHEGPWVADSWSTSSSSRSIGTPLWKGPGSYQGDEVGGLTLCQRALGGLDELGPTGNWCG